MNKSSQLLKPDPRSLLESSLASAPYLVHPFISTLMCLQLSPPPLPPLPPPIPHSRPASLLSGEFKQPPVCFTISGPLPVHSPLTYQVILLLNFEFLQRSTSFHAPQSPVLSATFCFLPILDWSTLPFLTMPPSPCSSS